MNSIVATQTRTIVHLTSGSTHGPITRLMSPGDLGQLLKPFVFLDLFGFKPIGGQKGFGMHPHSGIATLTYMIEGGVAYEDTTGKTGMLPTGGVEWMSAGNGVWHDATPVSDGSILGFQLWVALPASHEKLSGGKSLPGALTDPARRPGACAARTLRRREKVLLRHLPT